MKRGAMKRHHHEESKRRGDQRRFEDRLQRIVNESAAEAAAKTPASPQSRRRTARASAFAAAVIHQRDGVRSEVIVSDLSDTGAQVRSIRALDPHEVFTLHVPALSLTRTARIAWRTANTFGLEFLD